LRFFLDTNILIYYLSPLSPFYPATKQTLRRLIASGSMFFIAPQTLYEFWVMATRPEVNGGLGFPPEKARREIHLLLRRFQLLDDSVADWSDIINLAVAEGIIGRRIHDARIIAVMRAHGLTDVLSFDSDLDFFSGIHRIVPSE
jgi:predicted nucleic acid-binding protein